MTDSVTFYLNGAPVADKALHYTMCGLKNVYLGNGFDIEEDTAYGKLITVEHEDDLQKAIGLHIIEKPEISGPEFRFLRKQMGRTQAEMAELFKVDVQTVANYEKAAAVRGPADYATRLAFALYLAPPGSGADLAQHISRIAGKASERRPIARRERNRIIRAWRKTDREAA
jgi:putative transcriptional regulator